MRTFQEVFSSLTSRRRYEVWFIRFGLADGSGAWWLRYLLMNPGRGGCAGDPWQMPVQVWATWVPRDSAPHTFIERFPLDRLELSDKGQNPFHFRCGNNEIEQDACRGALNVDGHSIEWDLRYRSTFRMMMSDMGWIGFSATPHSDAIFSGYVKLDGRLFQGETLGFGLQGHNCGYRHRDFWIWAHAYFQRSGEPASTLEALIYNMPFGLVFRKAVLWHEGRQRIFHRVTETRRDHGKFQWEIAASTEDRFGLEVAFNGEGPGRHRLAYVRTNCSGTFEVLNNSLSQATMRLRTLHGTESFKTADGAVLEMGGL